MYNKTFDLNLEDLDTIEQCLNHKVNRLVELRLTHVQSTSKPEGELPRVREIDQEIQNIRDLLGRLHQQKNWYRPKEQVYVGG